MKNNLFKRIMSLVVCFALLAACLPTLILQTNADQVLSLNKVADPSTLDGWMQYFGPGKMDTEFAGAVWTDKSVFAASTNELPGIALSGSDNFLVALSAIASNMSITGHTSAPTDTMLVLDMSGSMVDDTVEVGTIRRNNNYVTAEGIDMSLIEAMVDATNSTIDKLMKQNTNNRVGVVLYSGNATTSEDAAVSTATVVLPLGRYTGINGEYLSIDTTWRTDDLYEYNYQRRRWQATGDSATYVPEDTAVNVSVMNGLKTESGAAVTDLSKRANGGTYIQNGLYQAMNQFLSDAIDTVVPEGRPQAGAERMPVMVLMTDGAPTVATSNYNNIGTSHIGDGTTTTNRITFMTQLTAAYVRGRVAAKYQENENDEKEMLFLTLGLGTENSSDATATLYPAGSGETLSGYWNKFLAGNSGSNVQIVSGNGGWSVYRDGAVEKMNYVDKYFYASDAEGLVNSFNQILSEIQLKAEAYATLVEGSSANFSGYVTFEDELGEMMQVHDVKGILMDDGQGNPVLYSGKDIAQGMTNGNLGTVDGPTERGNELVRTVRERIPSITTTQAQQLIDNAYNDQQLYYADDANWSNYIGWYADAGGNYVGFWDKDSGYENAPENAVYANRSYGYLGVNGDSDMMHVVVMVRTELSTLHQTVLFKIPASLLPTVHYKVTLAEDNTSAVEDFQQETAIPMRLVFEAGLRENVNSVNLNQKIAEHLQRGGHIHRNQDGTVTFYTNEWAIGNDTNGNGIPDADEVESAYVAESHFHPAMDNSRFYYTENAVIYDASGAPASGTVRPSGSDYHYNRYIYSSSGRQVIKTPIAEFTLANDAAYDAQGDFWYIPAGTMYRNFARFKTLKSANETDTLDYSFFPAVFENGAKQDVYSFLGNNGAFTVAPAQGIALTKTVDKVSQEQGAPTEFTFVVTLSQAVANPLITDTDGNVLSGISSVSDNKITVKLQAGQTVVISGIPTGTTYEVTEEATGFYTASSANATGTVAAYTVHPVDFVNTAKAYGALVVSKDVNYPEGFAPGDAHNNKQFPITVEFTGDISGITAPQGATQNGNTFSLALKDGQSVTFANIPQGVTYTVTEGQNPAGYAFQELRYSDTDQVIDGDDLDEAHVVNSYSLQPVSPNVKIQGDKTLITNESGWNGEEFVVELLRIDHFADEEPVATGLSATMTEANPHYEIDLSTISFDAPGTYYFRVVELIPANRNDNIAYDRTFGLFSITVGDADADGNLEIQQVHAYQATEISGDSTNGWVLSKDFTNVVTTDRIYLDIEKLVTDATSGAAVNTHKGDITFGLFTDESDPSPDYYALTDTHGKATLMIPVTKDILTDNGGSLVYYMREIAPAVENRVVGMNYDESWIYVIRITWDDVNNCALVEYAPYADTLNYTVYTQGQFVFQHTNTYESNVSVDLSLSGNKTVNGSTELGGRTFSFSLYHSSAAFVKGDLIRTVENSGNTIPFGNVTFTAPGIYYLVAVENDSALGGITTDATEYHITVEVEAYADTDGTTRLRLVSGYPQVVAYGTSDNVGAGNLNFNNLYTVTGEGEVVLSGKKRVIDPYGNPSDRLLTAGEFTFGLYRDSAFTQLIETVTNKADGTFAFSPITFTVDDLGENYAEATYYFYIKELNDGKNGFLYDGSSYSVPVTVSHENGVLTVTPGRGYNALTFDNIYTASPASVTLNGRKTLSGDWNAVANKEFTFQLFQANDAFAITDATPVKTATVNGDGNFSISLRYTDGQEGIYYYVLKEHIPAQRAGGVGYDAGEYHISVNVTDPGNGQLVAVATIYRPGTGNVSSTDFTNLYTVAPTSIVLNAQKEFVNATTNQPIAMQEGDFSFVVLENGAPVATGHNKADGTVTFSQIHYTKAGVHTYQILEVPGDAGGVIYDDTVFDVTVTVTDNGDGTLTAAADYNGQSVVFRNEYTAGAAQVTIEGNKTLSGDWSKVPDANKAFTFALYPANAQYAITGNALDEVTNKGGAFQFQTLSYTTEGTHYYVVKEIAGAGGIGITYSQTEYRIKVEVDDNGLGKLIPTVTTDRTVATDPGDASIVTVSRLDFVNTYQPAPVPFAPVAQKVYEGDQMKTFDFVLQNEDGLFATQTKQNDANGTITFDEISFTQPGTYRFKISEQENTLWGFIKWDTNIYDVTVEVADNGLGKLVIANTTVTSQLGRDDLVFRNVHEDLITQKDVFLNGDTTLSIDGKKVLSGDILTYTITYKNYTGAAADVVITDAIPQHTTYVDGSATNGGSLNSGVLTWNFQNVAADDVVTVSFQVKVADAGVLVKNTGRVLESGNVYTTNEVTNPVDQITKDVFHESDLNVSIDNKEVESGDILTYQISYTNAADQASQVTITDTIPQYTSYVGGSADNDGIYANGVVTWNLQLNAGETRVVSFQVKVIDTKITVENQAIGVSGGNTYRTNVVKNPVDEDIVVKNVFADSALSVSIDGKKVETGDILYYTITYTNADDLAGQVTITDTIPQYTAYVEGSATDAATYADGKLTWNLQLAAGESKTVSFQVKVTAAGEVSNQAQAVEGENVLSTNIVTNPVSTDIVSKDVFYATAPTVSIDGKEVKNGSILLYKVTYTNSDDQPATVTITDAIPHYTAYVEGSATDAATYADGKLTWNLQLAAGESKTVSFRVKVVKDGVTILNKASAQEGENKLQTNQVTNTVPVPTPSDNPHTGDNTNVALLMTVMLFSLACLFVLVISRKKIAD